MNERVTLDAAEAAARLGISKRLLRQETAAGRIPHVRIGSRVVYPVAALDKFLCDQADASLAGVEPPAVRGKVRRRRSGAAVPSDLRALPQPVSASGRRRPIRPSDGVA